MSFDFRWEWLNSFLDETTGKTIYQWTLYDEKIQHILTDAFNNNLKKVL